MVRCTQDAAEDLNLRKKTNQLTGVHPMIEKYPLSRVAEAYEHMMSGKARFRAVLTTGH